MKKRITFIVFSVLIIAVLYVLYCFNYIPHKKYTNADFNIEAYKSNIDKDNDGIDDQTDILNNANSYIKTNPKYKSKYYNTGYPNDEYGVCTDVVAFALKDAGYDLKSVGRNAPSCPDDKIVKGIDGLYENLNQNSNVEYIIDEAKFGKAQLGKTDDGKQMSDDWLLGSVTGNNRILDAVDGDEELAYKIMEALKKGQVERVLSKVDADGNVVTYRLDSQGNIIGIWP